MYVPRCLVFVRNKHCSEEGEVTMSRSRETEVRHRTVSTNTYDISPINRLTSLEKTYEIIEEGNSENSKDASFASVEKEIYEQQLTLLQEQLEAVTIEKESLALELRKIKASNENERQESTVIDSKDHRAAPNQKRPAVLLKQRKFWPSRLLEGAVANVYQLAEDFQVQEEISQQNENEGEPFQVKKLKENIARFGKEIKPYVNTMKGIRNVLLWKNPSYTFLSFLVYMYAAWTGRVFQLLLFCLAFRHFISLLQSVGLNICFNFFETEENATETNSTMGLSDKVNLVIAVARKVQNGLNEAANGLEKIKSVFLWRHVPAARKLFVSLCVAFIMSFFVPSDQIGCLMGLGIGIKLFIINYFYTTYPRLNQKYNSTYILWQSLPTQAQWEQQHAKSQIHQYIITENNENDTQRDKAESASTSLEGDMEISREDKEFCELFYLPPTECPIQGWQGGKRCSMVNKDKKLIGAFKSGKLYLTRSFLCFERSKKPSKSNLVIPLQDITNITKHKPFAILPGNGMAIEVKVKMKAFVFGGLISRDEAFDSIQEQGLLQSLPFATGISSDESYLPVHTDSFKRRSSDKFSFPAEYVDSD